MIATENDLVCLTAASEIWIFDLTKLVWTQLTQLSLSIKVLSFQGKFCCNMNDLAGNMVLIKNGEVEEITGEFTCT